MEPLETWLSTRALTAHSKRAYSAEVQRLLRFMADRHLILRDLDPALLGKFWKYLVEGRLHRRAKPSQGSVDQSRRIVSAFLRWSVAQKLIDAGVLSELSTWGEGAPSERVSPSVSAWSRIPMRGLATADSPDAAAVALSFWTGASPSELACVTGADIDADRHQVRLGRSGRQTVVCIPKSLSRDLARLKVAADAYVFGSAAPPTPGALAQRISRWLALHEIPGARSARMLRSQFLALARAAGWNSDEVRGQLRRDALDLGRVSRPDAKRLASLMRL